MVTVKGEVDRKEAVISFDTFRVVEVLVAQSLVAGETLQDSQMTLKRVSAAGHLARTHCVGRWNS